MGKTENQLDEKEEAVDALVLVYLKEGRIEEAFTAVRQGASPQTRQVLLNSILAAEDSKVGGTTGKIKMALGVASLGVPQEAIQHFASRIIIQGWLKSAAVRGVFNASKENMSVIVSSLIEAVIKVHISNGRLLSAQEAARLIERELCVDEINTMVEKHCRDGNINETLHVIGVTEKRKLTTKEINMLTEAVGKQQSSKSKAT